MLLTLPFEAITASNGAFVIPDDAVADLGGGGRPKVTVQIEGVTWRTSIHRMGGRYLLGLTKAQKAETGVELGQTYDVSIELDTAERTVEVPDDLARELAADPAAAATWEGWSFTRRKEAATALTGAKKPETRERRLAKVLADLRT